MNRLLPRYLLTTSPWANPVAPTAGAVTMLAADDRTRAVGSIRKRGSTRETQPAPRPVVIVSLGSADALGGAVRLPPCVACPLVRQPLVLWVKGYEGRAQVPLGDKAVRQHQAMKV